MAEARADCVFLSKMKELRILIFLACSAFAGIFVVLAFVTIFSGDPSVSLRAEQAPWHRWVAAVFYFLIGTSIGALAFRFRPQRSGRQIPAVDAPRQQRT